VVYLLSMLCTAALACDVINQGDFTRSPPVLPSVCAQVLTRPTELPDGICQAGQEYQIRALPILLAGLSQQCGAAVAVAACAQTYPACPANEGMPNSKPCKSLCTNVQNACDGADDQSRLLMFPSLISTTHLDDCNSGFWDDASSCDLGRSNALPPEQIPVGRCESYSGDTCKGNRPFYETSSTSPVTPQTVYIPPGVTQEQLEDSMRRKIWAIALTSQSGPPDHITPTPNAPCDVAMQAFQCASHFPPCAVETLAPGFDVALPRRPCRALCERYKTACTPLWSSDPQTNPLANPLAQSILDPSCDDTTFGEIKCDSTVIQPGQAAYPGTVDNLQQQQYLSPSFEGSHPNEWDESQLEGVISNYFLTQGRLERLVAIPPEETSRSLSSDQVRTPFFDVLEGSSLAFERGNTKWFDQDGITLETMCSIYSSTDPEQAQTEEWPGSAVAAIHPYCSYPMVYPIDRTLPHEFGRCNRKCPIPTWTRAEYRDMERWADAFGTVSLVLSIFLLTTYLISPENRKKGYIVNFIAAATWTNFWFWLGIRLKGSHQLTVESLCKSNAEEVHFTGFCLVQGVAVLYGMLACFLWWSIQAVDIMLKVVFSVGLDDEAPSSISRRWIYRIIGWGVPLVPVIVATASEQIGAYSIGQPWCLFAVSRLDSAEDQNLSGPFFYYPGFAITVVGILSTLLVVIRLLQVNATNAAQSHADALAMKYARSTQPDQVQQDSCLSTFCQILRRLTGMFECSSYTLLFFFSVTTGFFGVYVFVFKVRSDHQLSAWRDSLIELIGCLMIRQWLLNQPGMCGEVPKDRMPYGRMLGLVLLALTPGLAAFFIYGLNKTTYYAWITLFRKLCRRDYEHTTAPSTPSLNNQSDPPSSPTVGSTSSGARLFERSRQLRNRGSQSAKYHAVYDDPSSRSRGGSFRPPTIPVELEVTPRQPDQSHSSRSSFPPPLDLTEDHAPTDQSAVIRSENLVAENAMMPASPITESNESVGNYTPPRYASPDN